MKLFAKICLLVIASGVVSLGHVDDAFAKRLGGGRSFGGRPAYSQPYRPAPDAGAMNRSAPSTATAPAHRNQALRDSYRSRGGLMGLIGGLALGGLIGSLLFGGAFEHMNLMDLVVFGVIAYLMYRLFAARRSQPAWQTERGGLAGDHDRWREQPHNVHETGVGRRSAGFNTDVMARGGPAPASGSADLAGFDEKSFVQGSLRAYRHLQEAWDQGDVTELRSLVTDRVFEELRKDLSERSEPDQTKILKLDASLLQVQRDGDDLIASVLFQGEIQEHPQQAPMAIREVWHFIRRASSSEPTWYLDGIQQLAEDAQ